LIDKGPCQDLGLCGFLFLHYLEKSFSRIYAALYGDAMAAVKQQKHLSLIFA